MKLHRAFGCYGILTWHHQLVVIHKHGGPYTGHFDLHGGSLDGPEDLAACVLREVHEETGLAATIQQQAWDGQF
nr:NUDIX domain-containing protein [Lacticaseibacillus porcinae]